MSSRRPLAAALVALAVVATALPLLAAPAPAQTGSLVPPVFPNDITIEVLSEDTQDPTSIGVLPDGRVVWAERTGRVKVRTAEGRVVVAGRIPVAANSCADCPDQEFEEGGVHGLLVDRRFAETGRIYLYWSVPNSVKGPKGEGRFRLASFVLSTRNVLDRRSEQVVLEVPAEWAHCCHYGGDLAWMPDGTMVLSVGDDTSPREESYNPRDKRRGRDAFNADRTSQNLGDRRGKVLRFNPDGTAPADNPFVGRPGADPLVYALGFRSNYRLTVDAPTRRVYVGTVGADAVVPDANRGPEGLDELEVVPPGGGTNHGWPRCAGQNRPYRDHNYFTGKAGAALSCAGMTPAVLAYPTALTPALPFLAGQKAIMPAAVYRATKGALRLPSRFLGRVVLMEWGRDLLLSVPAAGQGITARDLKIESMSVHHPIDGTVGPDGALYLAEYGELYYENQTSRITRLTCAGCRPSARDYRADGPFLVRPTSLTSGQELAVGPAPLGDSGSRPGPGVPWRAVAVVALVAAVGAIGAHRRRLVA